MIEFQGRGGFAETICERAVQLDQDRISGDLTVQFYRTNKEHTEGCYWSGKDFQPRIRLGISTKDFYYTGLSTLFHELGHAQGLDHLGAVAYAHSRLHQLSGMKYMHNDQSIMSMAIIDRMVAAGIDNSADYSPRPVMIDLKRKGRHRVMEVCGPYEHVLPYLDARPDAKIYNADRKPIGDTTTRTAAQWERLSSLMGCVLVIPM